MPDTADLPAATAEIAPRRRRSTKTRAHKWTRLVHVYTSMISFFVVLFFAITGITLNHPEWTFGTSPKNTSTTGTLPKDAVVNGKVDWFIITEFLRSNEGVRGSVADKRADGIEGEIAFKGPAHEADATFNIDTRTYELRTTSQGVVGFMNDLHKGRDTRSSWKWLIDVSGGFLTLVGVTGLGLQFFLRKRRRSAISLAVTGTVLVTVLVWMASR